MIALHRSRKMLALTLSCFLLSLGVLAQTGVTLSYYDGTQQSYSVSASGKLYFQNGNLQILSSDVSSSVSIPVGIIRKINFSAFVLPLHFLDFSLTSEDAQVVLTWKTANEVNTSHFLIERSQDGITYDVIGQMASLKTSAGGTYAFPDQSPLTGKNYYRLKQVDADGKYTYSKVLLVTRTVSSNMIALMPNPATNFFRITGTTGSVAVKIYSSAGLVLQSGTYNAGEQIPLTKLKPGVYMVSVDDKTYKLIKK